jgi:hypothetical protein
MSIRQQALRFGQRRLLRRVGRAVPYLGTIVAVATVGSMIRRKGLTGGLVDSALTAVPYLGGLKIAAETIRGRDFIPDRRREADLTARGGTPGAARLRQGFGEVSPTFAPAGRRESAFMDSPGEGGRHT